jgi:antitoxin component of MazEF toxin-antitoxin module
MRAEQKLVRNGSATGVTIPKVILIHLGWLPGERIVVELLEDKTIRLRRPDERDYGPIKAPRMIYDEHALVTK